MGSSGKSTMEWFIWIEIELVELFEGGSCALYVSTLRTSMFSG